VTEGWAAAFVAGLHAAGVDHLVVAPGSRSTPLVMAFARHGGFRIHVQLDERSAGFLALGIGKATGVPAAVVTTSGTATANLFPAVVEAAQSESPLLVLTADRPPRLRGSDANQAIDQVRLYGDYPRWQEDLPLPSADPGARSALSDRAHRAVAEAVGVPAGAVHLNFPFEKPLEPVGVAAALSPDREPKAGTAHGAPREAERTPVRAVIRTGSSDHLALLDGLLAASRRPLVVAGPDPREREAGPGLPATADRLGAPLLADPLSGCRGAGSTEEVGADVSGTPVTHYDGFLRDPEIADALKPDLVVRLGSAPTSAPLLTALERWSDVHQVVLDPGDRHRDHLRLARDYLNGDGHQLLRRATSGAVEPEWAERWASADRASAGVVSDLPAEFVEGWVAGACTGAVPEDGLLFVSSSMPIRDVDAYGGGVVHGARILGNRGASGIDGITSSILGAALGSGAPTVGLLGDLAFFHDSNGLLAAREVDTPVVLVVVHNDGGGIFHRLPIARYEPEFTSLFATPHGLDFRPLCEMHAVPCTVARSLSELRAALMEGLSETGVGVIVVPSDRERGHAARLRAEGAVVAAARQALGLSGPAEHDND
jgi:2-succinyl-5-enolpyruvyl-6-hydroxy-3-cyclohexene-1-carboxylate synthase